MADINSGRFNRWIQKLFYIQSGGPASVHAVDPAIQTTLPYLNGEEERYLQGWNRFWISSSAGPNAGTSSGHQIRNPVGSGMVCVVERIQIKIFGGVATFSLAVLSQQAITTDLTTTGSGFRMDPRGQAQSVSILSTALSAANLATSVAQYIFTGTNQIDLLVREVPLLPGDALRVTDSTVNERIDLNWVYRERVLETSELS